MAVNLKTAKVLGLTVKAAEDRPTALRPDSTCRGDPAQIEGASHD
jgi:hypothetical protein